MSPTGPLRYSRKTGYYRQVTHEFNLPAGWTCPHASGCLTKLDRDTGKRSKTGPEYLCYAAVSERFPSVRDSRWSNFEAVKELLRAPGNDPFPIPPRATHIRIHGTGDFFTQRYFDRWLTTAEANPDVRFWAFTKSPAYWLAREGQTPPNLELQASYGGKQDHLIEAHGLKHALVVPNMGAVPEGYPVDYDDWYAQNPGPSFALLENFSNHDQPNNPAVIAHNRALIPITPA